MKKYNLSYVDSLIKNNVYEACARMRISTDDSEGVKVNIVKGDSAYLEIKPDEIIISYVKKYQIFYGLKMMAVNDRKKTLKKDISCAFEHLGVMLDCSRNAVPNVEFLKKYILNLAIMGFNELQLYTEDTYEVSGEPLFGYMRGRYSARELQEIVAYAAQFDMEVVPCIQTLAHLNQLFRWKKYDRVRDIDDILMAGEEQTYALIDNMFSALENAFTSRRVHIGMDEAHHLGRGKYLDKNGYEKTSDIILKHLGKVAEIAEKHGFKPMMWSDMFMRPLNGGAYYAGEATAHIPPETIAKVPENVSLVYWDYYRDDIKDYDIMFDRHAEFTANETVFAGGAWRWTGFAPKNAVSCKRTSLAVESAVRHGIKSFFLTMWGDDGAECSWNAVLPALSYTADLAYGDKEHDECFVALTGLGFGDFCALDMPDVNGYCPSKVQLYNDCFSGVFDPVIEYGEAARYKEIAAKLRRLSRIPSAYQYVFDSEAKLAAVLEIKSVLGKRTRELYTKLKTGDEQSVVATKKELKKLIAKGYKPLLKLLESFYEAFRTQWYRENKPAGFEIQDIRLGGLIRRVEHCKKDLEKLLKGTVAVLPELEEHLLNVETTELDYHCNDYDKIVSVNRLSW